MPYLNLVAGEPWAETWGVMLFPEDAHKRRAYIAHLWAGFYPIFEEANIGEPIERPVLLSIMRVIAATPIDRTELKGRYCQGTAAGEQLKVLSAIAASQPKRASWSAASRLVQRQTGKSRTFLYQARSTFMPVIHLWAAFALRGSQIGGDKACGYTALDDVNVFVTEAMALYQWGRSFKLDRKKAEPTLDRNKIDFWVPPLDWSPPTPGSQWPRDGRLRIPTLSDEWLRRVGTKRVRRNLKKSVHVASDK
jgi:hypothetical protein